MTVPKPNAATTQAAQPDTSIYINRFPSLTDPHGERDSYADWAELCADLEASIDQIANKSDGQGWSPVIFSGDIRGKKNAESISCMVLDYDKGTTSLDDAFDFWAFQAFAAFKKTGFTTGCLVHTSYSHSAEHPKFRVVLPLSRAVDAQEFDVLWNYLASLAKEAGHEIDVACKDPSRFWFLPACKPGDKVDMRFYETGEPVDVRRILKECGHKARSKALESRFGSKPSSAVRTFERGLDEIRDAAEGQRNVTLNKMAFKAGTLVGGGRLDEEYVRKELREAGLACGLGGAEVENVVHKGLQDGKQHPSTGDWDERPEVKLSGELHEHVQDAMKALGEHLKLFQKDGRLVCIETSPSGAAHLIGVEDTRLQEMMSECAVWLTPAKSGSLGQMPRGTAHTGATSRGWPGRVHTWERQAYGSDSWHVVYFERGESADRVAARDARVGVREAGCVHSRRLLEAHRSGRSAAIVDWDIGSRRAATRSTCLGSGR